MHPELSNARRARGEPSPGREPSGPVHGLFGGLEGILSLLIHSGKNHLGPIKGYASLIQDENDDSGNTRRWADKIMRNVRQMEDHLNGLDMFRLAGAAGVTDVSWFKVVNATMDRFATVNLRGVPIEIVNDAPGTFRQHARLLERVLVHLLANAYESIESGGKISLNIEPREACENGRRRFAVVVADTGRGIEEEVAGEIWKPFYSTKHGHLGLGLPYVAAASGVIGMKVTVESRAGHGTSVRLLLEEQGG